MASATCCAAGAPMHHEYSKQGHFVNVCGIKTYLTGDGTKLIIVAHDIFGFDFNQVYQIADRLASGGFVVAVPDLFDGNTWPMSKFPPQDKEEFMGWVSTAGDQATCAKKMCKVADYMKAEKGIEAVGVSGHCWGSSVALSMASDPDVSAVACCHPAFFGKESEWSEAAVVPVCVLASAEDPMESVKEVLDKKPFADKCFYRRFQQVHGWMAARGDYKDAGVAKAAAEGVDCLVAFFSKCM